MEPKRDLVEILRIKRELNSDEIKEVEDFIESRLYDEMCEEHFVGALVQLKPIKQLELLGYGKGFVFFEDKQFPGISNPHEKRCNFPLGVETSFKPYNPETGESAETVITWDYAPYVALGMINGEEIPLIVGNIAVDVMSLLG